MSAFIRLILRSAALALLALPTFSHAVTTRCVGSEAQLVMALNDAHNSSDSVFIIRLRSGTYDALLAAPFLLEPAAVPGQVVELSGGWSGASGSCQDNTTNASATVLLGTASAPALRVKSGVTAGTAHVHDITLHNANNYVGAEAGSCLRGVVSSGGTFLIDRVQMSACITQGNSNVGAASIYNAAGTLTVRNVVVRNNKGPAVGGMDINTAQGGVSRLSQLSITGNQSVNANASAAGLKMQNDATGITYVSNSVVWGNTGDANTADIFPVLGQVNLTRVHYGSLKGTPTSNNSPGSGDPGLVSASDPRPRFNSILIDSGVANPQGGSGVFDVEGSARVLEGAVDVGAYESDAIFQDGFE